MVHVIKGTADIYCFCKNWYETAQEHPLFKLPSVSFKQIEKFLHFSSKICLIQNRDPRAKNVWQKPDPSNSEQVRIPGGRLRGWLGLELTDTLFYGSPHYITFITYENDVIIIVKLCIEPRSVDDWLCEV